MILEVSIFEDACGDFAEYGDNGIVGDIDDGAGELGGMVAISGVPEMT